MRPGVIAAVAAGAAGAAGAVASPRASGEGVPPPCGEPSAFRLSPFSARAAFAAVSSTRATFGGGASAISARVFPAGASFASSEPSRGSSRASSSGSSSRTTSRTTVCRRSAGVVSARGDGGAGAGAGSGNRGIGESALGAATASFDPRVPTAFRSSVVVVTRVAIAGVPFPGTIFGALAEDAASATRSFVSFFDKSSSSFVSFARRSSPRLFSSSRRAAAALAFALAFALGVWPTYRTGLRAERSGGAECDETIETFLAARSSPGAPSASPIEVARNAPA